MTIRIRLFAGLADRIGSPLIDIELPPEVRTAGRLKQWLITLYPSASDALASSFVAVNQEYANDDDPISERDEIAVIPPVSGGQPDEDGTGDDIAVQELFVITADPISPEEVTRKVIHPNRGAVLAFVGTTREWTQGQRTVHLEYEAYEPMAIATMRQIGNEIMDRWPDARTAITHRIGRVDVAEISVVIAVAAPHRAECYEASRYAIERLKQIVPIWKKEIWEDGSEWKGHQLGPWNPTLPAEGM